MLPVEPAFKIYVDRDGKPLDDGYIYFGQANQNPVTAPVVIYWDAAGTQPAAQPLRTKNGYIVRNGTPANIFVATNYSQLVRDKKQRQVYFSLNSDDYSIATTVTNLIASLTSSIGASLIGFIQLGVGAVARTLQLKGYEDVNGADFGMVADWNGITGTVNTTAFFNALNRMKARGGGVLTINPGDYFFGDFATSADVVSITDLVNTKIVAHGARFILRTTADDTTPFLLVFDSPNNVVLEGARFFDAGFNPASWQTHSRWGMGGVRLKAASACSGFTMRDCIADNVTYLLISDLRAQKRNLKNITVEDCRVTNAYYGVDVLYVGDNLRISNLICQDVRRGLIGYGMRNFDADIKLYTSSGFLGSNAFVSITCEGEAYNDGNGILGQEGNVRNGRVKLKVSGFEAHSAYVHFYHQQNDSVGDITGIDCDVQINNLSSAGKNVLIGPTNMYLIDHELPNSSVIGATTRQCKQLQLDGSIRGTITGVPIQVDSINNASPHTLELSPNLTALSQTYTVNGFTVSDFISPFDKPLTSLNPIGGTVPGVPTGLTSVGSWTQVGKRVFFSARLSWTAHTGTGQLRLDGLPKPLDTTRGTLAVSAVAGFGLAHTAGTALIGLLGGTGGQQILFYEDNAGAVSTVPVDGTVSDLMVSGSYPTP